MTKPYTHLNYFDHREDAERCGAELCSDYRVSIEPNNHRGCESWLLRAWGRIPKGRWEEEAEVEEIVERHNGLYALGASEKTLKALREAVQHGWGPLMPGSWTPLTRSWEASCSARGRSLQRHFDPRDACWGGIAERFVRGGALGRRLKRSTDPSGANPCGEPRLSPPSSSAASVSPDRVNGAAPRKRPAPGVIGLHECRHTFASLMIAAGVNAKALSTYMGHANISITLDLHGHLMPGNEAEAAERLDAYLARAAEPHKELSAAHTAAQASEKATEPL